MFYYRDYELLIRQRLDSNASEVGSDDSYYSTEADLLPAFNMAVISVTKLLVTLLESSKIPSEALSELRTYRSFITSSRSSVDIGNVMFIEAVFPLSNLSVVPSIVSNNSIEITTGNEYPDTPYSAKLLTSERESQVFQNPFTDGYVNQNCVIKSKENNKYISFSYTTPFRVGNNVNIKIYPLIPRSTCTVKCISEPDIISAEMIKELGTMVAIPLPKSLLGYIVEKAIYFISYKQGDGVSMGELAENEIDRIYQTLT